MNEFVNSISENKELLLEGIIQTLSMTFISLLISVIIGIPLGILLVLNRKGGIKENRTLFLVLNVFINIVRSIPFIILLFFLLPLTWFLTGTTVGVKGVIFPLVVYTAPYIARLMESAILEVDNGVVSAYQAMGISTGKIVFFVMLREARSGIILGLTIAAIGLIGATAMAGLVGAGGLGDIAYRYGHVRYEPNIMYTTIFILIVMVQSIQSIGNYLSRRLKK